MRLTPGVVPITLAVLAWKQADQQDSDDEAPNMRPPGNAAGLVNTRCGQRRGAVEELHDEPETEDDHGWNFDDLEEHEYRHKRQTAREWIRDEIGSQHACNRAAGSDARHRTAAVEYGVDNSRADPA